MRVTQSPQGLKAGLSRCSYWRPGASHGCLPRCHCTEPEQHYLYYLTQKLNRTCFGVDLQMRFENTIPIHPQDVSIWELSIVWVGDRLPPLCPFRGCRGLGKKTASTPTHHVIINAVHTETESIKTVEPSSFVTARGQHDNRNERRPFCSFYVHLHLTASCFWILVRLVILECFLLRTRK